MTPTNKMVDDLSTTKYGAALYTSDYKVYINHTDAGGIVYHANHLVFFENCRRDWFTQIGLDGYFMKSDTGDVQHFVISQAELKYKKAILLDETISVRIDRVEVKPASIVFFQSIHRIRAYDDESTSIPSIDTLLTSAKIVVACVQNQLIPDASANLESNESGSGVENKPKALNAYSDNPMRATRLPNKLQNAIKIAIGHVE